METREGVVKSNFTRGVIYGRTEVGLEGDLIRVQ